MTKYSTTPAFFIFIFLLGNSFGANAQQLAFACPTSTVIRNDVSNNDPQLWNAIYWFDTTIGTHDMAEEALDFNVLITDSCTTGTSHFRFILDLDLDGNGLRETRIDSDSLPGRDSVHFNNIASGTVTGGVVRQFDFRPVAAAVKYRFYLSNDSVGPFTRRLSVRMQGSPTNNSPAILPYGTHAIQWRATNGCGQTQTCGFSGQVRDGAPPTVVCINGLSINLMNLQPPSVILWASDFLQYTEDNYTPSNLIRIAVRRKGQPDGMGNTSGFPRNADGTPQTGVSFNCADIGSQEVVLWALDSYNLVDSCNLYILIQDNALVCSPGQTPYIGVITTENNVGVADVEIFLESQLNGIPSFFPPSPFHITNSDGYYGPLTSPLPLSANALIVPSLNIDPLNGVNTWDLILISRHILGLEPLNSPYKIIAADANKSGTVTTFDIVELRKLILGTFQNLPFNNSWRFLDKAQVFTNPANPFADIFRESILISASDHDFIGVKIGDVDYSASPNFQSSDVRTEKTATITTKFISADKDGQLLQFLPAADLAGYQMTVHLGENTLAEIIPQGNLTNDHFAVHERNGETVLTAVSEEGAQPFALRFRNPDARFHPESVHFSNEITPTLGYDRSGSPTELLLHYPTGDDAVVLHPNTPNPWRETTAIRFELPRAGAATLRFFDATGRLAHEYQMEGAKGINTFTTNESAAFLPGLYTFSLEFEGRTFVQKIIKI